MSWIGGMVFLSVVLAPLVRQRQAAPEFLALFRTAALRFRLVVWSAIAILLSTGPLLLTGRGYPLTDPTRWPTVLYVKLGLVGLLLLLTVSHDLLLGPLVGQIRAIPECAQSSWEHALIRGASWVPRLSLLLALAVVVAAVVLVRL